MADAPAMVAVCAVYKRVVSKYGGRGERYVDMEAGGAAQNLALSAAAMALGCTVVGAFDDAAVHRLLGAAPEETPLLLVPVGVPG